MANYRKIKDTIGYATDAGQMDSVRRQADELAAPRRHFIEEQFGWSDSVNFIAAVCPHDDFYYAARLYSLVLPRMRARRVVLCGVSHRPRPAELKDRLVFDSFDAWCASYAPVPVATLREIIKSRLAQGDWAADNALHQNEHSIEALAVFLQAYNPKVEIVPILVPNAPYERLDHLATALATVLASVARENGWRLGEDLAVLCSNDAVHYGDAGWGGSGYHPYGCDAIGHQRAVAVDEELTSRQLCGPISPDKLNKFYQECADPADAMKSRITWCGRFAVTFGLLVTRLLTQALESRTPTGCFLDYGTSVSEASLDVSGFGSLGATAPNNFHHFVGYAAVGYV